jgi:urease accessory protein UreG
MSENEVVPIHIGIGGPVGSGKTQLIERLLPLLERDGLRVAVITNDLVTKEDAERMQGSGLIDPDHVVGVETGACPHTAIREDPSANLGAVQRLEVDHGAFDVMLIESGGDNLAATFTADLVDSWIYVIDTAAGDDSPRKRGLRRPSRTSIARGGPDLASAHGLCISTGPSVASDWAWLSGVRGLRRGRRSLGGGSRGVRRIVVA